MSLKKKPLGIDVATRPEHDKDIDIYIRDKLRIRDKMIEDEIRQKAEGVFMWVILVIKILNQGYEDGDTVSLRKKLREVPNDLDEVFSTLLVQNNLRREATLLMLQWLLFTKRPLEPEELYFAVIAGTDPSELRARNEDPESDVDKHFMIEKFITSTSRGLVEIRRSVEWGTDRLQFIHGTAFDFLVRKERLATMDSLLLGNIAALSHDRIMACCTEYILMDELAQFGTDPIDFGHNDRGAALFSPYPFLAYASTYVFHHGEIALADDQVSDAVMQRMLRLDQHFTASDTLGDGSVIFLQGRATFHLTYFTRFPSVAIQNW